MNKQLVVKTNRAEAVIYIILSVEELTVFVLFFFVLCTLCCQFLWIIYL
jgi:hypothetical protein